MRKIAIAALLIVVCSSTAASGLDRRSAQEYRVVIRQEDADQQKVDVRHRLTNGKASVELTGTELGALQAKGVAMQVVPQREAMGQKSSRPPQRTLPDAKVPYGVRMVYGSPAMTNDQVKGGKGVTVAVLDSGIAPHRDFMRNDGSRVIAGCVDFTKKKAPVVEGSCDDKYGHGTHVTGTIAAAGGRDGLGIYGVAPGVKVLSYKVLDDKGQGYADDIARAIRFAADHGANIISLSLGAAEPFVEELESIRYAVRKGVLVIAAAGNAGPNAGTVGYPAAFPEVMAVGALSPNEAVTDFSSRGISDGKEATIVEGELELVAPGFDTLSTYNDGTYAYWTGTSMAAPHIAGLAAKMWQGNGARTRAWLKAAAQRHDITTAAGVNNAAAGYDIASGYGLPQVVAQRVPMWTE